MWHERQASLQLRRGQLAARSQALRERLAHQAQPLRRPLALADSVHAGVRWLAAHPQWLAGIVAVPLLLRPRRAVAWALKLWWGWRMWRRLQGLLPPGRP